MLLIDAEKNFVFIHTLLLIQAVAILLLLLHIDVEKN